MKTDDLLSQARHFWIWFEENEDEIYRQERIEESLLNQIAQRMAHIHPSLEAEITGYADVDPREEDDPREFVISPGLDEEAVPAMETLYETAPDIARWTFMTYKPRRGVPEVGFSGTAIDMDSALYKMMEMDDKLALLIFMDGVDDFELEDRVVVGRTIVIPILGERSYMTWVKVSIAMPLSDDNAEGGIPLTMLAEHFDEYTSEHSA